MSQPNASDPPLRQNDVRRRFDRAALEFAGADFVHRHSFDGLLERLRPIQLETKRILDIGAAAGSGSRSLAKRHRGARVTSVDFSHGMLKRARANRGRFAKISEVQADALALPFSTGAFDLAVANQLLPWLGNPQAAFLEVARVLREGGVFLFSALGPDSLRELRETWQDEDSYAHVNPFMDMHEVGDALVRAGLRDPVLDVDKLTITYQDAGALFRDLTAAGARNALAGRRPALTGKRRLERVRTALEKRAAGEPLRIDLEIVFGHAWGGGAPGRTGEYRIAPGAIGRIRSS